MPASYLALLILLLLMVSPLAPLITSLVSTYRHTIETMRSLPPHIYFPTYGKDLGVEAWFNGTHLVVSFTVKNTCRVHVYSTPSGLAPQTPDEKGAVLIQGFYVIAERSGDETQCRGTSKTLVLPLPRSMVRNSTELLLFVNDQLIRSFDTGGNVSQATRLGSVIAVGGAYPFFDHDVRVRIKWATIYGGMLYLCLAVTHDGGGDYVGLIDTPPGFYRIYGGKPRPIYTYRVNGVTIIEIHLLAVRDLLVLQSATCKPIP